MGLKSQFDLSNMPYFQYDGRKSNEMGMRILKDMELVVPEASFDTVSVDGLSRDVILDKNSYKDIDKTFPVRLFKRPENHIAQTMREVAAWLYSKKEYLPVTFSAYDEYFYKGFPYGGTKAADNNVNGLWVDFEITFKMQPFIFRVDGTEEKSFPAGISTITNPEEFPSLPIVEFNLTFASTDGYLYINGRQWRFTKDLGTKTIVVDSEKGIAYDKATGENISSKIFITNEGYTPITLEPGRNTIRIENISNFKITPNWRTLAV